MKNPNLLSPSAVAKVFGVDPNTVARWVREGKLTPAVVTPGGQARYTRKQIDALVTEKTEAFMRDPGRTPMSKEERIASYKSIEHIMEAIRQQPNAWRPARSENVPTSLLRKPTHPARPRAKRWKKREVQQSAPDLQKVLEQVVRSMTGMTVFAFAELMKVGRLEEHAQKLNLQPDTILKLCAKVGAPAPPH